HRGDRQAPAAPAQPLLQAVVEIPRDTGGGGELPHEDEERDTDDDEVRALVPRDERDLRHRLWQADDHGGTGDADHRHGEGNRHAREQQEDEDADAEDADGDRFHQRTFVSMTTPSRSIAPVACPAGRPASTKCSSRMTKIAQMRTSSARNGQSGTSSSSEVS